MVLYYNSSKYQIDQGYDSCYTSVLPCLVPPSLSMSLASVVAQLRRRSSLSLHISSLIAEGTAGRSRVESAGVIRAGCDVPDCTCYTDVMKEAESGAEGRKNLQAQDQPYLQLSSLTP